MRTYTVTATRSHYKATVFFAEGEHAPQFRSPMRIRQFTLHMFRKIFGGLPPTEHWHSDGFVASASDKRGNNIFVEQENHWHRFRKGATQMARPLCPMIIAR